jgi:hypothetical protein
MEKFNVNDIHHVQVNLVNSIEMNDSNFVDDILDCGQVKELYFVCRVEGPCGSAFLNFELEYCS